MTKFELDGRDMVVNPPQYPSKEIKEILGGRWDKEAKGWRLAPTSLNVLCLQEWYGDAFLETAPDVIQDLARVEWDTSDPTRDTRPTGFEGWSADRVLEARARQHPAWETLYEFQKEAVEYMCMNPHMCALLGLAPGLGKTPVTIVTSDVLKLERILVLAPVTLTLNWNREIDAWAESGREVKRATSDDRAPGSAGVTVANHEVIQEVVLRDEDGKVHEEFIPGTDTKITHASKVKQWIESGPKKQNPQTGKQVWSRERITRVRRDYANVEWDAIVVDESILLKNRKAVKADVLSQIAGDATYVWMLSGSPTSKFRDDLYRQLNLMFKRGFTSYWRFAEFFCIVERGQWGWSIEGDRPGRDPQHYLRDFLFIHTDDSELPDYIYNPIVVEMHDKQRKAFDAMLTEWIVELEDGESLLADNHLAQMTRLQQITSNMGCLPRFDKEGNKTGKYHPRCSAKEDLLIDLIRQGDIQTPLLVWVWWVPTGESYLERLQKEFKDLKVGFVHGALKRSDKDDTIDAYKDGTLDVLVMQYGVGKFGHTLTDTRTVFYADRSFDSDAYFQSLRRVKRIGLKHRPRMIVPKCEDSADELIDLNLAGKLTSIARMTNADLAALLKSLPSIGFEDDEALEEEVDE